MRAIARLLLPLLVVLGILAWSAAALLNATARSWFERDVAVRARLAVSGARDALATQFRAGDERRLASVLDEMAQDDAILGIEACSANLETMARTPGFPLRLDCGALVHRLATPHGHVAWSGSEFRDRVGGAPVHVSVVPVADGATVQLGSIAIVHDLSFVDRRETAMRRFTLAFFAVVALLASWVTIAMRRVSWRSWTEELRGILTLSRLRAMREGPSRRQFQPLLADLRQVAAELAHEQAGDPAGRWSAQRLQRTLAQSLDGDGVLVVANRAPYIHERTGDGGIKVSHPASGLVTALEPVMRACSGTWIAHGSGSADRDTVDRHDRIRVPPAPADDAYTLRRIWLTPEEERGYYGGLANEGLWPLCHVAHTRPVFRASDWRHYQQVNERFANAVCEEANGPDPIVLVQDYHFALVPQMIRRRLPRATSITFWHIPWPNAERFAISPWHRELLSGLLGSSIVGFHTQLHCNNFIDAVDRYLEARVDRERQSVVVGGRESLVRHYPISIEWPNRWADQTPPAAECRRSVAADLGLRPDALLGVGVDRLDYTKGIEERLLSVERLLERFPHLRGRFTFAQLGAPSRTMLDKYRELNDNVERVAARVNERFGAGTYRPIALLRAQHDAPTVFRYLRAADVCYVSSLHDGMNLVAKEFVAARDDERGVLVLSRFTGAARELTEALVVNPYDLEEASAALATAVAMPESEQAERMRAMRGMVSDHNVYRWAGRMLVDAARVRQRGRLSDRLSVGLRAVEGGR